jgi:SAM-dependent methyltransferase
VKTTVTDDDIVPGRDAALAHLDVHGPGRLRRHVRGVLRTIMRRFRLRRVRHLVARFPELRQPIRVLDVGGYDGYPWREFESGARVTLLNLGFGPDAACPDERVRRFVIGDGRALPFRDGAFDVVYSNSVIEHVGGWADQIAFARELRRVASRLYCQTPNRWFFVEPHLLAPFLHWLPTGAQQRTVRWLSVWGWMARPDGAAIAAFLGEIRLTSRSELRQLFPDCAIERERFAGMTKSFLVVRR